MEMVFRDFVKRSRGCGIFCAYLENWQSKVVSYGTTGFMRGVSSATSQSKQEYQPIAKRHSLRCQVRHEYRLHRDGP